MRLRLLTSLVVLAPAVALAQPAPGQPPPPPPPQQPAPQQPAPQQPVPQQPAPYPQPQPAPYPQPQPYPPPQPYPQPQPYPAPQPYPGQYQQPYQQPYQPPPGPRRDGMTFELNLGLGFLTNSEADDESDTGIAGLDLGIGGWMNSNMAITGRIAAVTISDEPLRLSHIFIGPTVQYWTNKNFWVGGGAGLSVLWLSIDDDFSDSDGDSINGFGLDLRAGYSFDTGSENTFNISLELTPGFYSENGFDTTITGVAFLLGYQHL
ncbi:MAG: hypothetical protein AB7P03_22655 [Kofleriaceae bacterium]